MANKLRLSFSLLSAFEKGLYNQCVDMYLHKGGLSTPAILEGRALHKKWEKEIKKTKKLKIGKTELKFKNPLVEYKFYVPYNEIADLSVVIDCLDAPYLYEWKSGNTTSTAHSSGYQVPFYFLACLLKGIEVKTAYLLHYNQETGEEDTTIIHNGVKTIERARNYIDSLLYGVYELIKSANAL